MRPVIASLLTAAALLLSAAAGAHTTASVAASTTAYAVDPRCSVGAAARTPAAPGFEYR